MTRLLVTSVVRRAGQRSASGYLRVIDEGDGAELSVAPVPESAHREADPNPRGGLRGARGTSFWRDRAVVANAERVLVFDQTWGIVDEFTHPLTGGIHDLLAEEDGIWVTCTSADLLVRFDWNGTLAEVWDWRLDPGLVQALGFDGIPPVDRAIDYRDPNSLRGSVANVVHLNAVTRHEDRLLLSFGRILSPARFTQRRRSSILGRWARSLRIPRLLKARSAVPAGALPGSSSALVALEADRSAGLIRHCHDSTVPNHNVVQCGEHLLFNDSNASQLVVSSLEAETESRIPIPGDPPFARGLVVRGRHAFVGSQAPAAIYRIDLDRETVDRTYRLDGEPSESVYCVTLMPDDFDEPRSRL